MKQDPVEALVNLVNSVMFSLHRLLAIAILGSLAYGMIITSDTYRSTAVDSEGTDQQGDRAAYDAAEQARQERRRAEMDYQSWVHSEGTVNGSDPEPQFDNEGGWAD